MRPAAFLLLLLAVGAGGALVWFSQRAAEEPEDGFLLPVDDAPRTPPKRAETPDERPVASAPSASGLPRILPPDAAVEDIRDALARKEPKAREAALQSTYDSIGRIAQQSRILVALQRYAGDVEDAAVRGVTWAALGANREGSARAWLAGRLSRGPTLQDRVGALLGLAYDPKATPTRARSLGGLPHRRGTLPERLDVRAALASLFVALQGDTPQDADRIEAALLDVLPVLESTLTKSGAFYKMHGEAVAGLRARLDR